jgi:hypothetical protein
MWRIPRFTLSDPYPHFSGAAEEGRDQALTNLEVGLTVTPMNLLGRELGPGSPPIDREAMVAWFAVWTQVKTESMIKCQRE